MALREPVRSSATSAVLRQTFWLCLILASLHLLSISARSQITLVRILKDTVEQKSPTAEVYCIRKNQRPPVRAKMALEIGDKLYSESRSIKLEVNCGGATYLFTAPLSVVFRKPTSKGCFTVYSSNGRVNVISRNTPTKNQVGLNNINSPRTEYEIRMFREKRSWLWRLLLFRIPRFELVQALVYEGEVDVKSRRFSETLKQGQKVILSTRGAPIIERVTPGDFLEAAKVYAEFDVGHMSSTDPGERQRAFHRLVALHEAVLREPENSQGQNDLNRELKSLGIPQGDVTPSPSPPIQTPPDKGGSQSNEWTKAEFEVRNHCKKTHEFRITPQGLQFPHRPLSVEITVLKGANHQGQFEFDMAAIGRGVYDGEWFIECLDCHRERRCEPVGQRVPFKLKQ